MNHVGFRGGSDADHHHRSGESGTRAMSHTLAASGVWMGEPLNGSGDLLPPQATYEASRLIARHVRWLGGLEWDFSRLHTMHIPPEFEPLIRSYLQSVLRSPAEHRGWKIPETTLTFPWIVRMFTDVRMSGTSSGSVTRATASSAGTSRTTSAIGALPVRPPTTPACVRPYRGSTSTIWSTPGAVRGFRPAPG